MSLSYEEISHLPFSAASFEKYIAEHNVMATRYKACGGMNVPPRAIFPNCQSDALEWMETSGKGRLAGFTVIYSGPTFLVEQGSDRKNPYISGIVELDEGPRISARILGVDPTKPADIQIGTLLTLDFVEAGRGETKKTYLAFKA